MLFNFINKLYTKLPILLYDILAIPTAWFLAYWLRYNLSEIPYEVIAKAATPVFVLIIIQVICYYAFKVYRGIWHYSSLADVINIIKSIVTAVILTIVVLLFTANLYFIPRSIWPIYSTLLISFLCGGRLLMRWRQENSNFRKIPPYTQTKRTLIIGAGRAGESLVRNIKQENTEYHIVGFIDDEPSYLGQEVHGVKVLSKIDNLVETYKKYSIEFILIAIPTANSKTMRRIVTHCEQTHVPFRTLPNILDIASGKIDIKALREVKIDDLLGRDQVDLDWGMISDFIENKRILITGGGGSIGSELCRQVARLNPKQLLIIDNSEYNLYKIQMELNNSSNISIFLACVTDHFIINKIMSENKPDIVFHAAAYKHVPLLEEQSSRAVFNNILGTKIVADCSRINNVEKFILISTDKAVNPTNVMGATKRIAEIYCQNLNNINNKTKFITVRFGNVLGSTGSVVPLFQEQLKQGGPLTVTHPDIERYFMTIPEASRLILQATSNGQGGEIFVLDMGEPIKIRYLAEQMIRLAGKRPYVDIQINYIGLRSGEKLYEELFYDLEKLETTAHNKILMAKSNSIEWDKFQIYLFRLIEQINNLSDNQLKILIKQLVPEYKIHFHPAQIEITESIYND
ncbi:MAG: polysaccharide biosynthesis protein [Gammaproteobacteria bacterium]|nr:polysaccharide biosynthesis protein [Gammaproteobacteria bacterium]